LQRDAAIVALAVSKNDGRKKAHQAAADAWAFAIAHVDESPVKREL
jgi:hypothetical protein